MRCFGSSLHTGCLRAYDFSVHYPVNSSLLFNFSCYSSKWDWSLDRYCVLRQILIRMIFIVLCKLLLTFMIRYCLWIVFSFMKNIRLLLRFCLFYYLLISLADRIHMFV